MADIFISYKREDRQVAERLSVVLGQLGFDVWWDFELLSGDRFRQVIRAVLDQCAAVVVLWSAKSIQSPFVLDEANHALRKGKLFPAQIDEGELELPFGFGQTHTSNLAGWDGQLSHAGFQDLVRALEQRIGRSATLGGQRKSSSSQANDAELDGFKATQVAGNISALRVFLKNFPNGMFAEFVRNQLEQIEADNRAAAAAAVPVVSAASPPAAAPVTAPVTAPEPAPFASDPLTSVRSRPEVKRAGPPMWLLAGVPVLIAAFGGGVFVLSGGWDAMKLHEKEGWAAPLVGAWAPEGLTCEFAVSLQVYDGMLAMTGDAPQLIDRLNADGAVVTIAGTASYAYHIDGNALTIEDLADNRKQGMVRC